MGLANLARKSVLASISGCLVGSMAVATSGPIGVSPGQLEESALIDTRCPTFSWTAQPGAAGYDIVVLEWAPGAIEREPVLRQSIPTGAVSWTPALDRCLEWGGRYAWLVSESGDADTWSKPLLFQVASREVALAYRPQLSDKDPVSSQASDEAAGSLPQPDRQPPLTSTPPVANSPSSPSAPASSLLMVAGVPVTLESYDHSMVFDAVAGIVPEVTMTDFEELGKVSVELGGGDRCPSPFLVTRWNVLVLVDAIAFSRDGSTAAQGDLAVSIDDPTGSSVDNDDVQSFSVDPIGSDTPVVGISYFRIVSDLGSGTRDVNLLARRRNLNSANIGFNNYRIGVIVLGFDCESILAP